MITAVEVVAIHDRVVEATGGSLGVADPDGILAAVARPFQTFGGEDLYPTVWDETAAMLESLCNRHPFIDGNKRTALVAAVFMLHRQGFELDIPTDDGEAFMLRVAQGWNEISEIAGQLRAWQR